MVRIYSNTLSNQKAEPKPKKEGGEKNPNHRNIGKENFNML
jgi:hypothetical protein